MKELPIQSRRDPIRAFFACDLNRAANVMCACNKAGNEKRFYREMLSVADREFTRWLKSFNHKE